MAFDIDNVRCIEHRRKNGQISAIKVTAPIFRFPEWVPFWAVDANFEVWKEGTSGTLMIDEKFAEDKGWL